MDKNYQCVKCKLRVGVSRSLAFIQAVLELACITSNRSVSYQLVNLPKEENVYLFHRLRVHSSHRVAIHFGLKVHFCTRCGHYGQPSGRSVGLAHPCSAPSRQGSQALRNIIRGKWPSYVGKDARNKVPKIPRNIMDQVLHNQS